jgi:hypothetical protein
MAHEFVAELFRNRPEMTSEILEHLGCSLPESDGARVISAEFNDITPTEYRADVTITRTIGGDLAYAVIVESQQRPDRRKRFSWPVYVATLHARLECPVFLLVTCPSDHVAQWCGQPIVIGAERLFAMSPIALDLENVPKVTDVALAERLPELAVLSAAAHGGSPGAEQVLEAVAAGFRNVDDDHADLYYDYVAGALPTAALAILRRLMSILETYRPVSDWGRRHFRNGELKGKAEGKAEGEAEALLTVLSARGFDVPAEMQAQINGCADTDLLKAWIRRAVTVNKLEDLFR